MSARPGLEVEATLARGEFRARVSLSVARGGALGLLGPNGAGKSTVMRAVAGLDPIASGRIRIDGVTVEDTDTACRLPARERRVGYVFQDYRLFPHLTVLDNVGFGLWAAGLSRRAARRQAGAVLERAGLERFSASRPADLSGGEAQRIAVARALAPGPRLLLLDEPLAALDVENRAIMREHLKQAVGNFEASVLLVSHDPGDALAISDEIAIIEDGRIIQRGSGRELSAAPASAYVARLVGRTGIRATVASGTVVGTAGRVRFTTMAGPMEGRAVGLLAGDRFPPGPAFASFNPAAVRIEAAGRESRAVNHRPDAKIRAVEPGLGRTTLEVDLAPDRDPGNAPGGRGSASVRATVSTERAAGLQQGDRVSIEIPSDAVQLNATPGS